MMSFSYWEPVLIVALTSVIATCGLFLSSLSGQISLATAAWMGVGGYASAILTTNFGVSFGPALFAVTVGVGLIGGLVGYLISGMRDFVLKLTTLALGEALSAIAFNIPYIGGPNGFSGIPFYTNLPIVAGCTAAIVFCTWRFDQSRLGLASRAIRDDRLAAASCGVKVVQVRVIGFALSAAFGALAGGLLAHYLLLVVPSQMGWMYSMPFLIYLLGGGMFTPWGPIIAALLLTALPEALRFASEYRQIVFGFIIVVVVMFRPDGFISYRARVRRES
jgi:branched-chain amino acid transport system permease protein